MTDKTWTVVGTSIKKGEKKLRLANGSAAAREAVLTKDGHTEVRLFDLPRPMTAEEATKWLEQQGDAIPVRAAKEPKVVADRPARKQVAVRDPEVEQGPIEYEDLGRAAHASSVVSFRAWEDLGLEVRQEICRNAARKAGLPTPRGMFPALEAFLATEGVTVTEDGELVESTIRRR